MPLCEAPFNFHGGDLFLGSQDIPRVMWQNDINSNSSKITLIYTTLTAFQLQQYSSSVVQSQKAVSAYFTSNQILPFGFAEQPQHLRPPDSSLMSMFVMMMEAPSGWRRQTSFVVHVVALGDRWSPVSGATAACKSATPISKGNSKGSGEGSSKGNGEGNSRSSSSSSSEIYFQGEQQQHCN